MTHDDETVERVARAIYEASILGEEVHHDAWDDIPVLYRRQLLVEARAALSAMPPRELLREALSALQVFADYVKAYDEYSLAQFGLVELDTHVMGNVHRGNPGHPKNVAIVAGDMRRARAAADKIRAALEQQQKGEGL